MTTSGTLIFDAPAETIETINLTESEKPEEISAEEEIDEEEDGEEQSFDDLIGEYDFAVIFKTEENDINIVVPEIEDFESLSAELKQNVSQNQFLMGFINYALNNEDWLNEYSFSLQNKKDDMMQKLMSMISELSELGINDPKQLNVQAQEENKSIDIISKDIDFTTAVEQLNKNKPKIIT
jgi:hypothetical protein